jgi:ribose transport system ATP-binding protein
VIKRLAAQGTTVVYISHRLSEIFRISDHVTVMKDGKVVGTYRTQDITSSDLVKLMVGRDVGNIYPARNARIGETVLEVKNLKRSGVLKDVRLSVRKGEIVGIAGLVGAGRTELARAIFGADPVDGGEVYVGGKRLMRSTPASRIRAGLGLLPEDRRGQGLVLSMDVSENVTLANIRAVGRVGILSPRREKDVVRSFVKKLRIKTPSLTTKVRTLSGGNQQKVALAKWLNAHCKVLIVDEPTRGIDVGAKHEIYELLNSLAESGVAILMISSELPEILGMCDRVLVMHEGELVGALSREEATEEKIMALATGMERQHQ